jgi:BirA family biotin operon repressor/biotin-[acetyl-CoA-carboxylase] ligase
MIEASRVAALVRQRGLSLGSELNVAAVTVSTNDDALAAARAGAPHGATFVAEQQTKGRGRRGASWLSAPGESLTFSVLLRPNLPAERTSALSLAVGLAVRESVARRVSAPVLVKWPNDVLAEQKKLAGVLIESQIGASGLEALVVGIGINVATRELPVEIADLATSLALLGAVDVDRESLLVDLLGSLETRVDEYVASGLAPMLAALRAHDALYGKRVRAELGNDSVRGVAGGIDESGALIIVDDAGTRHAIVSGMVRLE